MSIIFHQIFEKYFEIIQWSRVTFKKTTKKEKVYYYEKHEKIYIL